MKEIRLEETSVSAIHGKNGRSKKATTSKVDMKFQNRLSRVYIQNLSYSATNGIYSKGLFNAFRETMAEAS